MKWLTFRIQREPGFRLNLTDMIFIVFLGALSWGFSRVTIESGIHLLPLYLGGSFFLFCNVFRIGEALEAFWYVPFTAVAGLGLLRPELFWPLALVLLEPLKVGLIVYRIRRGPYVGVFHEWLGRG